MVPPFPRGLSQSQSSRFNGEQLSSEEIVDKFHITTQRIGPAEIGNWGQPFRKSAWFAVRNLNGTIDDLALLDAALRSDEIHTLFKREKPLQWFDNETAGKRWKENEMPNYELIFSMD